MKAEFCKIYRNSDSKMIYEIAVRVILLIIFIYTETIIPFHRMIQPEEMWLYKYPRTESYFPVTYLWLTAVLIPLMSIAINTYITNDHSDVTNALKAFTLTFGLNGVLTNMIKVTVGRPRPDFYARCFPDGQSNLELNCTGDPVVIINGRKSFPSGHSSFSFACMGFVSLFMAFKLNVFNAKGQRNSTQLVLSLVPLCAATLVAISRTCDYHHHWQDVTVGGVLGLTVAYVCFRQYYPPLTDLPPAFSRCNSGNLDSLKEGNQISIKTV